MNDEQILLAVMVMVPEPEKDNLTMTVIRNKFFKADKPHTEQDIRAEYRLQYAQAIIARWKKATMRA